MSRLFNKELLYRALSLLVFIPIVILPIFLSNYIATVVYLLFVSLIMIEINLMKLRVSTIFYFNIYQVIVFLSFFLFILMLITKWISVYELFFIIIVIWLFDTFSYLGGKIIGGVKLMPKISSGKTVSGLIAGLLMTLIVSKLILNFFKNDFELSYFYIFTVMILSFIGDTLVSLLKRTAALKDTGNLMPGHGGILDRFDSFIMVFFIIGIFNLLK